MLSVLLWTLVLAPAAHADTPSQTDTPPSLTDTTTGSTSMAGVGDTVTLTQGSYMDDPGGDAIQDNWYDCNSDSPPVTAILAAPVGCTAITPTTPTTYVVAASDEGYFITVYETDAAAVVAGDQTNQAATIPLAVPAAAPPPPPPAPTNQYAPSIAGTSTSGSTLTAVPGGWTGTGNTYAYSWSRCNGDFSICTVVGTGSTYTLSSNDIGGYLLLSQSATATNAGGSATATATSAPFGPITTPTGTNPPPEAPDAGTAVPSVSGTPQLGATLTAAPVTMSNNPSYTDQWLRCVGQLCAAIPGATSTTYSPVTGDLGDALAFSETGTNAGGSGQAQSTKTAVVTAPTATTLQIAPAGVVAGHKATLIATVTSAAAQAPPAGVITFEQAGTAINGCASLATHAAGASATITCQTTFAGSASTLSAAFTPNPKAQVTGSDSTATGFVLGHAATTTTMDLPADTTLDVRLTLTATVVPDAGTEGVSPTGAVVFLDGEKAIKDCTVALTDGVARCPVIYTNLGTHSLSADYLGDGNFSGSGTGARTLRVVVAKPTGFVSSLMTWTFQFAPHYTRVSALTVTGVEPGITISAGCSGSGCPKHRYVDTVKRAACGKRDDCKNVNLAKRFAGDKLGIGASLTVRLTHPGWLGKYYSFLVRGGRKPKIDTACLAVGETKPGVGCTPG